MCRCRVFSTLVDDRAQWYCRLLITKQFSGSRQYELFKMLQYN